MSTLPATKTEPVKLSTLKAVLMPMLFGISLRFDLRAARCTFARRTLMSWTL